MTAGMYVAALIGGIWLIALTAVVWLADHPLEQAPQRSRLDNLDKPRWPGVIETERQAQETDWADLDNPTKGTP